jgi:hypothetical protein
MCPIRDPNPERIILNPDPRGKRPPDPESTGSATLGSLQLRLRKIGVKTEERIEVAMKRKDSWDRETKRKK